MKKKEEKAKVGRPKLADTKMKKKATIYILVAFVLLIVFVIGGTYSLYGSFSTNKLKGKIINDECTKYWNSKHVCPNTAGAYGYKCTAYLNQYNKRITNCVKGNATKYRVVYNANNGTGTMKDQYITYGVNTKLYNNSFYKGGKKFKGWWAKRQSDDKWYGINKKGKEGWFKQKDIKYVSLYSNGQVVSRTVAPGKTVIMYAQWDNIITTTKRKTTTTATKKTTQSKINSKHSTTTKKKTNKYFTVKFRANGGTGTMKNQSVMHGNYNNNKLTKLQSNKYTKKGYIFIGWNAVRSADNYWYGYNSKDKLGWYSKKQIKKYYYYKDRQGISRTVAPGASVTMWAQWKVARQTETSGNTTVKTTNNTSTIFKITNDGNNCYIIYAPANAKYWRVHVYYKKAGSSTYGSNKFLSYNHYNDGYKSQKVCLKKQKYNSEDYRILVKKTKDTKDTADGQPSSWRPNGFYVNNSIGWAYKDYRVNY